VAAVTPVAGKFFKDADPVLIEELRGRGLLYRAETYRHNYPFGWRTGDPLIYYAKNAWYIRTTDYRDRLVELNKTINWVPETIRDGRFGNWLEHNVDWALSRERFWGTPLPVWTDGEGDFMMIGSLAELEALAGRDLGELDLHRPAVDEVTFVHPDNGRTYRRVPEVIDCWFDSGAMSYAQWHYPFENRELFEERFPADYICEAIDQTRGWFYTLHAIATLVSDSVAFRNCVCLAHIVDKDGKKMSKSLGNIVNPYDVFDTVGADALRWYLAARIAPEVQKRISVELVADVASTFINTFWNTYAFFVLYARLDKVDLGNDVAVANRPEIDRWILALLQRTTRTVTTCMDGYDARGAGEAIENFVDQLSNWYVRRNRRRFWKAAAGDDKQAAYLTLYECLHVANRLMAPLMPFITESVHQNLVRSVDPRAPASVHMADWPKADAAKEDESLIGELDVVQRVVGLGRAARNDTRLRVRQPLKRLLVRVPDGTAGAAVESHQNQILEELNVKALELVAGGAELLSYRIKPNLPRIGKRYGKRIPAIRDALARADGGAIAASVAAGQRFDFDVGGETLTFEPEDVLVESTSAEGYASAEEGGYLVGLDTRLDDALLREGLAREIVRTVQDARKQAGLEVSDRIVLKVTGNAEVEAAVAEHRDYIMEETLASARGDESFRGDFEIDQEADGNPWHIALTRDPG
jgi:isoleucyl-tRNA synthetase